MNLLYKVVNKGEGYLLTSRTNLRTFIEGPTTIYLPLKYNIEPITQKVADSKQHFWIKKLDGTVNIVQGPGTIFHNPLEYFDIAVKQNIYIDEFQKMRIQQINPNTLQTDKDYTLEGPCFYVPDVNDKYHMLTSHGVKYNEFLKSVP